MGDSVIYQNQLPRLRLCLTSLVVEFDNFWGHNHSSISRSVCLVASNPSGSFGTYL